ncbi:MAG: YdeI/OmpD-associated family protein [Synechococcales bacterium]|nr:YdeI/OmpD-associated family protein [Synechococcales bacterium]
MRTKFEDQLEQLYALDRQTWRQWLIQHHQDCPGIWLVYYNVKSGKPSIKYRDAVKEALCFGWIDSKVRSLDEERYMQIFTPRKTKSVWSKLNKQYVEELIAEGLMTEAGLARIQAAKEDGSWHSLDNIEALIIPQDLQAALEAHPPAQQHFAQFSNSMKKNTLYWIESAKRPSTRSHRIERTILAAIENRSPLQRPL